MVDKVLEYHTKQYVYMFCCTSTGETGIYWYYLRTLHLLLNASCPLLLSVTIAWGPWSPFITCIVNTSTRSPQHGVYIHMYTYHCTQRTKQTLYALSTIPNTKLKYLSVAVMVYFPIQIWSLELLCIQVIGCSQYYDPIYSVLIIEPWVHQQI